MLSKIKVVSTIFLTISIILKPSKGKLLGKISKTPFKEIKNNSKINCSIFDHIHFRKIEFWDISYPAIHYTNYTFNGKEVYFSFCDQIPEEIFSKCGISKEKKAKYFYLSIENGDCQKVKFSQIKYIYYSKLNLGGAKEKELEQISIEFFVGNLEHSITYPDFNISTIQYKKEQNIVKIRMPLGLMPPTKMEFFGPKISEGFIWNYETFEVNWFILQGTVIIFTMWTFLGYKLGEKTKFKRIRPFDLMMNIELFSILFKLTVESFEDMDDITNSLLVGLVPVILGLLINWKIPSFSWRVSFSNKI